MKTIARYANILIFCIISLLFSCKEDSKQEVVPKKTGQARIGLDDESSSRYTYFFFVNGVRYNRGDQLIVRADEVFYVELRHTNNDVSSTTAIQMPVVSWSYDNNYIQFQRQYYPMINNANQYAVISPDILVGTAKNIGQITASFSAFPGTSSAERQPVYISLLQLPGGLSNL